MKLLYALSLFCFVLLSCKNEKNEKLDDLIVVNDKGAQEVKVDELSVEDVERLMNSSSVPVQSYTAILVNDLEKTYYFNSDTNQMVKFILNAKSENITLNIYKEQLKSVKKDSVSIIKVKDYSKIYEGDSFEQLSKKAVKYKATVKLIRPFESKDSTAEFSLNIFKK